jgi:hypothetical protein
MSCEIPLKGDDSNSGVIIGSASPDSWPRESSLWDPAALLTCPSRMVMDEVIEREQIAQIDGGMFA